MADTSLYLLFAAAISLLGIYHAISHFRALQRRRALKLQFKYEPLQARYNTDFLGLAEVKEMTEAFKSHTFLERTSTLYKTHGRTYSTRVMMQTVINTVEPENIKAILASSFDHYDISWRRKHAFAPLLGGSIFQLDGISWTKSRSILRPAFTHSRLNDLPDMEIAVGKLLQKVKSRGASGSTVDLRPLFDVVGADLAMDFIRGVPSRESDSEADTDDESFFEAIHNAGSGCERRWQLGMLSYLFPQKDFYKNVAKVHAFMDAQVDEALSNMSSQEKVRKEGDFIATLAQHTSDRTAIRDEACMLFIAAADALACLLTNMFFLVAKYPEVWAKLREELQDLKKQPPTVQQTKTLKYHRWCVCETLRLLPVLPNDGREANRDTILPVGGGPDGRSAILVPAGTSVSFSIMTLHRREDLWGSDAHEFRPERWEKLQPGWNFIPFLQGPRMCLGHELAMTEAIYILARMAQTFTSVRRTDDDPWIESVSIGTTSANGAKVVVNQ